MLISFQIWTQQGKEFVFSFFLSFFYGDDRQRRDLGAFIRIRNDFSRGSLSSFHPPVSEPFGLLFPYSPADGWTTSLISCLLALDVRICLCDIVRKKSFKSFPVVTCAHVGSWAREKRVREPALKAESYKRERAWTHRARSTTLILSWPQLSKTYYSGSSNTRRNKSGSRGKKGRNKLHLNFVHFNQILLRGVSWHKHKCTTLPSPQREAIFSLWLFPYKSLAKLITPN